MRNKRKTLAETLNDNIHRNQEASSDRWNGNSNNFRAYPRNFSTAIIDLVFFSIKSTASLRDTILHPAPLFPRKFFAKHNDMNNDDGLCSIEGCTDPTNRLAVDCLQCEGVMHIECAKNILKKKLDSTDTFCCIECESAYKGVTIEKETIPDTQEEIERQREIEKQDSSCKRGQNTGEGFTIEKNARNKNQDSSSKRGKSKTIEKRKGNEPPNINQDSGPNRVMSNTKELGNVKDLRNKELEPGSNPGKSSASEKGNDDEVLNNNQD